MNRYIDVDKFCEKAKKISDSAYDDSPVTRMSINLVLRWMKEFAYGRENAYGEKIPPVPYAIDIVRCKDCKYMRTLYDWIHGQEIAKYYCKRFCDSEIGKVELNDFCSYGERKETE